jgi:hypothetical protein
MQKLKPNHLMTGSDDTAHEVTVKRVDTGLQMLKPG